MRTKIAMEGYVRHLLKRKEWQRASDRALAKEAGCSRVLVRKVRMSLIKAGMIEPPPPHFGKSYKKGPVVIRGGYYLLPSGKVVGKLEYHKAKAKRRKSRAAKSSRHRSPSI